MTTAEALLTPDRQALTRWSRSALRALARAGIVSLIALAVFGAVALTRGVNPLTMYVDLATSTFGTPTSIDQIINYAAPLILAALAVAVPARSGLINIGGQGQLMIGAVFSAGVVEAFGDTDAGAGELTLLVLAGALGGLLWAGVAAALRVWLSVNEAISTLLLNYVATFGLYYLVYGPWRSAQGTGQPISRSIPFGATMPLITGTDIYYGIFLALAATLLVAVPLRYSRFGFRLRTVGGNALAARRSGLRVGALLAASLLIGGLLAGLAGAIDYAGVEQQLRPTFAPSYGYIAFLASWLAGHNPVGAAAGALLLAVITVAGNNLQLSTSLSGDSVYILMAVLLLAALASSRRKTA